MATTVINTHKVENFAKWKQGFEAGATMREQAGIVVTGIYQSIDDENSVTVISEFPNSEMAKAVLSAPAMIEAMEKSGVTSVPEIKFLNSIN